MQSPVQIVPLTFKTLLQTDTTTNWRYRELELDHVEGWGPRLLDITIQSLTESETTNFQWNVVLWYSLDGKSWAGPYDLVGSHISAGSGNQIHAPFSDRSKLGQKIRLGLSWRSSAGSAIESGIVSASGFFRFVT